MLIFRVKIYHREMQVSNEFVFQNFPLPEDVVSAMDNEIQLCDSSAKFIYADWHETKNTLFWEDTSNWNEFGMAFGYPRNEFGMAFGYPNHPIYISIRKFNLIEN